MNWITGIQRAIDYVEEHLTEPVDYEEVAKQALSSSFHFQRVFAILCGFTLGAVSYTHLNLIKVSNTGTVFPVSIFPIEGTDSSIIFESSFCVRPCTFLILRSRLPNKLFNILQSTLYIKYY